MLEHVIKVIGLHDHIVEFQERKALLHALFVAFGAEHVVHTEARAHFAQQLHIIQVQKPLGIVQHHGLAFTELNKALHLTLEALGIVRNILLGQHFAHIRPAGRIADHSGAAANQRNGPVARQL